VSRVVEITGAQSGEERGRRLANQLLNATMTYGRLILRRYGELGPYGFSVDREGQIARETLEIPRLPTDPSRLWKLLEGHIVDRARRGLIQATAMAANVNLDQPSAEGYRDAFFVDIEEAHGYAVRVTIPYRIYGGQLHNLLPRRIALGKMVVEDAVGHIFTGSSSRGLS
jgi:hypothetical protein